MVVAALAEAVVVSVIEVAVAASVVAVVAEVRETALPCY